VGEEIERGRKIEEKWEEVKGWIGEMRGERE
jgi:hypothetical protein